MHRIDTSTAQKDKFGAGKNGFTRGNPQTGTPATDLDDDYFDMLQEELVGVVEASGIALDKTKRNQLLEALLRLGAGAPAIGVPFFWPSATMPNLVMPEWSGMVFLKFNGASFSAATYPRLALAFPALLLPEARGEFPRIWDDGRGVDSGRSLLSAQSDAVQNITGTIGRLQMFRDVAYSGPFAISDSALTTGLSPSTNGGYGAANYSFDISRVARTAAETRSRNIAFNLLVRAK
ncbi:integrase [Lelliottia amnigena]|uniref:Integrase n=1 Tax=Lelliottia amnigena TaxID=61646 RepID=A0AAP2ABX4_LELAM|nr:integrase [Lelliottia amnigena]MBL5898095.1 integrase [Lelliottia amnigena]MBL5934098.1 integrase [Lelliottia amnigena]